MGQIGIPLELKAWYNGDLIKVLSANNTNHDKKIVVTLGLCVKNNSRTIRQSIECIIRQKYPGELIQLVVVDGSSKDDTLSIIGSALSKTNITVEYYSDEGKGLGIARQLVFNNAKGKYVIFVDGDVRLFRDCVRNHVKFMEENPGVNVAFGIPIFHKGTLIATICSLYLHVEGSRKKLLCGNDATVYRSKVLPQIGGFDPNFKGALEDQDLMRRIRAKGWLISVNEKARYFHDHRADIRSLWLEQNWIGYGAYYFHHKYCNTRTVWTKVPIVQFFYGMTTISKAYELTHRKIAFLIPSWLALINAYWWFGFIKGYMDRYEYRKVSEK